MLMELWGIDFNFSNGNLELMTTLEIVVGMPFPTTGPEDFNSLDKPVQKKGIDTIKELMMEESMTEFPNLAVT